MWQHPQISGVRVSKEVIFHDSFEGYYDAPKTHLQEETKLNKHKPSKAKSHGVTTYKFTITVLHK